MVLELFWLSSQKELLIIKWTIRHTEIKLTQNTLIALKILKHMSKQPKSNPFNRCLLRQVLLYNGANKVDIPADIFFLSWSQDVKT